MHATAMRLSARHRPSKPVAAAASQWNQNTEVMQAESRSSVRTLAVATGTIGGTLIAMAAQVLMGRMNLDIAAVWHDLFVSSSAQLKSALAWWLIAAAALAGGFLSGALTRFLLLNWWPLRWLRWIVGAAVVAALGVVGQMVDAPSHVDMAPQVAASFAGMVVSVVGAAIGAFFAARG